MFLDSSIRELNTQPWVNLESESAVIDMHSYLKKSRIPDIFMDRAANPVGLVIFWCICSAIRVERMEIMDVMDRLLSTP